MKESPHAHLHAEERPAAELGPEDVEDMLSFPPVLVGKELKREEEPHADAEGGDDDHGCDVEEAGAQNGEDMAAEGLCLAQQCKGREGHESTGLMSVCLTARVPEDRLYWVPPSCDGALGWASEHLLACCCWGLGGVCNV